MHLSKHLLNTGRHERPDVLWDPCLSIARRREACRGIGGEGDVGAVWGDEPFWSRRGKILQQLEKSKQDGKGAAGSTL